MRYPKGNLRQFPNSKGGKGDLRGSPDFDHGLDTLKWKPHERSWIEKHLRRLEKEKTVTRVNKNPEDGSV
jgi:hypothetical protein